MFMLNFLRIVCDSRLMAFPLPSGDPLEREPPYRTFTKQVWRLTCLRCFKRIFATKILQLLLDLAAPDTLTCLSLGLATPFCIEWSSGILPFVKRGELQITYCLPRLPNSVS